MLSPVEVTAKKEHEAFSRPPHSEMRFDYLDEWEYAQDVTFLKLKADFNYNGNDIYRNFLDEENIDIPYAGGKTAFFVNIPGSGYNITHPYIKYVNGLRFYSSR